MFFSTFTMTFTAFDVKNAEFGNDIAVMQVSKTLQSNSYIFSRENFRELCESIGIVKLKFAAGITGDAMSRAKPGSIFDVRFFGNRDGVFYCSNVGKSNPHKISDFITLEEAGERTVVSRIFPIVVEDEKVVRPMHLVVVAWN